MYSISILDHQKREVAVLKCHVTHGHRLYYGVCFDHTHVDIGTYDNQTIALQKLTDKLVQLGYIKG